MPTKDASKIARDEIRRLWAIEGSGRPGPKAAHDARRLARAGIELADELGFDALSMRNVAKRLSTSVMSLYSVVPGRAELLEVMVDEVAGEISEPPSGGWQVKAGSVARQNWNCYERHPWLVTAAAHRPVLGPNVMRKYEIELGAFEGTGLTDVQMDTALNSLLAFTRGCAIAHAEAAAAIRAGSNDKQWWEARAPLLEPLRLEERFPLAARVGTAAGAEAQSPHVPLATFEFGLQLWIDGMSEALARANGHET